MNQTTLVQHLETIARMDRRLRLLRSLAICWGWGALAGSLLLLMRAVTGWWLPAGPIIVLGATGLAAGIIFLKHRSLKTAYRRIVQQIELDNPRLNTLLLAALDQKPEEGKGELSYLQQRVVEEALEQYKRQPWNQKYVERLFFVQCSHAFTLVIFAALTLGLMVAYPAKKQHLWAATSGVEVTPGHTKIEKGSGLVVLARFNSKLPQGATMVTTTKQHGVQRLPLTKNLNDPVFGGSIPSVSETMQYFIEYGNERTPMFNVEVFEFPSLVRSDAQLKYPDYTGLAPKRIEDTRRVSAVEGTALEYVFHLNKPVTSAKLRGKDEAEIDLTPDPSRSNVYTAKLKLEETKKFQLHLVDAEGLTNKVPDDIVVQVFPNKPADLKLAFPRKDIRVSPLEEIQFQATASDDFGLKEYGLGYTMASKETQFIKLGEGGSAHEKRSFQHMLALEQLSARPEDLITYFLWAEDIGPDGNVRRTTSDMFFAEIRPFEEIFRQGQQQPESESQSEQSGQGSQGQQLIKLQKEIINATWNLQRRESGKKISSEYAKDAAVIRDSQKQAITQGKEMQGQLTNPRLKPFLDTALKEMEAATKHLAKAADDKNVATLSPALTAEQTAYQALLKLQAKERQVSRSRSNSGQGQSESEREQLDQLEMKEAENRYETQRLASKPQTPQQREQLQVLNRLKDLAQRQEDVNERLKELQIALQEAKTEEEKEAAKEQLKRLQEEQREIVSDMDELAQRMNQSENQSSMAESRNQLENTRSQAREASEQMENGSVSQALASGTRAQRDLQQLRDDFRKKSSEQFSEEMKQLRTEVRQLAQNQESIAEKMQSLGESGRKKLSDTNERNELAKALNEQKDTVTNLLTNMRRITEQAEGSEPLLSKQLYDTLRKTDVNKMNNELDMTGELLRRGFVQQATQAEQSARTNIVQLQQAIERAAESILGDEGEALRLARNELESLSQQLENEIAQATGQAQQQGRSGNNPNSQNQNDQQQRGSRGSDPNSRNQSATAQNDANSQQQQQAGEGESDQQNGTQAQSRSGQRQSQQSARNQNGQRGSNGQSQNGEQNSQQPGEANSQSESSSEVAQDSSSQGGGQNQGNRQGDSQARSGQRRGGLRSLAQNTPQSSSQRGGSREGGSNSNDGGGFNNESGGGGPLTGGEFRNWSDRLGNLEEMVDVPDIRNQITEIRERARAIRNDYRRHSKDPQWDLVKAQIATPLAEVRNRINEELARRESKEALVPIDRDPVPSRFNDLVRKYYERLGNGN